MASLLDQWNRDLGGVGDNLAHLQHVPPHLHLTAGDSRNIEEIIHQPHQVRDLTFDDLVLPAPIVAPEGDQPKRRDNWGERISQLVSEHRQKLVLGSARLRRFVEKAGPSKREGAFSCHRFKEETIGAVEGSRFAEGHRERADRFTLRNQRNREAGLKLLWGDRGPRQARKGGRDRCRVRQPQRLAGIKCLGQGRPAAVPIQLLQLPQSLPTPWT